MIGNTGHDIRSMLDQLADHSQESITHSKRVAGVCRRFGAYIGLRSAEVAELVIGAQLHDIGKCFVSTNILHKPAGLTSEERRSMSAHPGMGAEHAMRAAVGKFVLDVILNHHERWDGRGYPNGLEGDAIPWQARVVALADTYDTIISKRVYDPPRSVREAVSEIEKNAGTQFDPELAGEMLRFLWRQHARVLARAA